jgi:hypothetical protein
MIGTGVHVVVSGVRGRWARLWALDGAAVSIAAVLTVVVELGAWALCRAAGLPADRAVIASLGVMVLWVPLAAAANATGAEGLGRCCLRRGGVADVSGVTLIVFWLTGAISFLAAMKLYCVLMAVAILVASIVSVSRRLNRRVMLASLGSLLMILLLASPVWLSGPAGTLSQEKVRPLTVWAVRLNPFFAATDAVADRIAFVWTDSAVMYRLTPLGDQVALPQADWYWPVVVFLPIAGVVGSAGAISRRLRKVVPPVDA